MKQIAADSSLRIRTGTIADLPLVTALYGQLSDDTSNIERDYPHILKEPNSDCLILENVSGPVGMTMYHFTTSLSLGQSMEIDEIVIDKGHRSAGLGSLLMKYCLSIANERDLDSVTLKCSRTEKRLHEFYERLGFRHRMQYYSYFPQIDESE